MRFSAVVSAVLLAAAPAAAGTLGFALGTKKPDGSCKYQADYEADFDAIAKQSGSKLVRGYAASDCNNAQYILPAAKSKGFQVVLGVWPESSESFNADKSALSSYVPKYADQVYAITVGSEALYRGDMTAQQLLSSINQVKRMFPNIKVGTADSWNKYADGTADPLIQGGVELFLVNAFGYWQGQPVSNATHQYFDDIMQAFTHIENVAGGNAPEMWTGETGWPTDGGSNYGSAIASTKNADTYYHQGICGMLDWGYNVFAFEAFDEPWKPVSTGDNGQASVETVWGVMNADRSPKFSLHC